MSNSIALSHDDVEVLLRKMTDFQDNMKQHNSRLYIEIIPNKIKHKFEIPHLPGVYFFWSDAFELMYIGSSAYLDQRIPTSLKERQFTVGSLSYTVCDSEEEARQTEEILIYLFHPRGNVVIKSDEIQNVARINTVNPYKLKRYEVCNEFAVSNII